MRHDGGFEHGLPLFFPYRKIAPHTEDVVVGDDASVVMFKGDVEIGETRDIS